LTKKWVLTAFLQISILELTYFVGERRERDAELRLSMSEMQKEIYRDPKHQRARCREGEMPKVRREETGTTHYCFSGKNLQKELTY